MKHLQLQCLNNKRTALEPDEYIITGFNTVFNITYPVIKVSQLISPFLAVILTVEFLQKGDLILGRNALQLL